MILARLKNVNLGKPVRLRLVLSAADVEELARNGRTVVVDAAQLAQVGIKNLVLEVGYGPTDEAIAEDLRARHGLDVTAKAD
ncbi:MAG TPA: hypothetical protein VM756_15985 [Burkholderiales bacterium]|nr:hypothetical protein [Burkholderiales bacterium]